MPFDTVIQLVQTVGAPTAIAVLVILRVEKRIDRLADAIIKLPINLATTVCTRSPDDCPFKRALKEDRP